MGDRFDDFVDEASTSTWIHLLVCMYLPYRSFEFLRSFLFETWDIVLVSCAVHLSIQMQSVDVGRSLDVWRWGLLIVVGFVVIAGRVAITQEATDQELFVCGELKLLRLLFLERRQQKNSSQHGKDMNSPKSRLCILL